MDDATGQPESKPCEPANRRRERRGRRAVVLSPRELPAGLQQRIWSEAVDGGLKARVIFSRHDLGAIGINFSTFRRYIAAIRRKAPPRRLSPSEAARCEAAARALLAFLEIRLTPKASGFVVAMMARERLGGVPAGTPEGPVSARFVSLARRLDAFLALACERAEVDKITRALCRWQFGGWKPDDGSLLTEPAEELEGDG